MIMLTEWLLFLSYRAINIKQLTDYLLGKPHITVLYQNLNRIGRVVFFGKDEKISRTVAVNMLAVKLYTKRLKR